MLRVVFGITCFVALLLAQSGAAQPPFNRLRGNITPANTAPVVKPVVPIQQFASLYTVSPGCPSPYFGCCGPVCFQPYCLPPVYLQSFSVTIVDPAPPLLLGQPLAGLDLTNNRQAPAQQPPPAPIKTPPPKPRDELEIRADMQRLLRKGNEAFAAGEYKTALGLYQQAVAAAPLEPMGYFHLAQAHLAVGKLAEAGVAIERGMRLHPNWQKSPFQPRALYGDQAGDFQRHLGALAEEVGRNMNDESLLFLLAYQLWFDGQRAEATLLFERAGALAHDTTLIDRFLKAARVAAREGDAP